jgi:CSLREA domain-containing protein
MRLISVFGVLLLALVMLLASGIQSRPSIADIQPGEYSMFVDAPDTVLVGEQFVVNVGLAHSGMPAYQAAQWHVDYDETKLSFVQIVKDPGAPPEFASTNDNGVRTLMAGVDVDGPEMTYSGAAFIVTYECDTAGVASLDLFIGASGTFVNDGFTDQTIHTHDDTVSCVAPVNSNNDVNDSTCDETHCSLREAIIAANATSGVTETISFDLPSGHTISPGSALPTITDAVIIDGTTEPDFTGTPIVELDGTSAGSSNGLYISGVGAAGTTIRGLVINRFTLSGIRVESSSNVTIAGNYIGTDVAGVSDLGNTVEGVFLTGSPTSGLLVGGTTTADRNVISGNGSDGIDIGSSHTNVIIAGNYVGTNAAGSAGVGNSINGIRSSSPVTVGLAVPGGGNVVSGNSTGVRLDSAASGSVVQGNKLGTNAAGTAAVGNLNNGLLIAGSSNNTVGGTSASQRNIASGNNFGIAFSGGSGSTIRGNHIGTDVTGTARIANTTDGIEIFSSASNVIGGTATGARNLISGNGEQGITIRGAGADNNLIQGNYVGTDVSGASQLDNERLGVSIESGTGNVIGGTTPAHRNVISGNGTDGSYDAVAISGGTGHSVLGNYIGVAVDGTSALPNSGRGVAVATGGNIIGSTTAGAGNVIANHSFDGVVVVGATATNNPVRGNSIYSNSTGINNSAGGNGGLAAPTIGSVGATVTGTGACSGCNIDVYGDDDDEGRIYLGSTTESGGGAWTYSGPIAGAYITAIAHDPVTGNTSEFSSPVAVTIELVTGAPGELPGFAGDTLAANNPAIRLSGPHGLFETPGNILYFADTGNDRIREINPNEPTGIVNTVAGGGSGTCNSGSVGDGGAAAPDATLCSPTDVIADAAGNIYIADTNNCRVRRVDAITDIITTIAGTGTCGYNGDNIAATTAQLNQPHGVGVDPAGNVLIADTENDRIRRVDMTTGIITTIAGTGTAGYDGEGQAHLKQLNRPHDVFFSTGGHIVIADTSNHRIRRIHLASNLMQTIAGTGTGGYNGDDIAATSAQINGPEALQTDDEGNVYFADTGNHRVRFISADTFIITTLVGTGQTGFGGIGGPGDQVELTFPAGVTLGSLTVSNTGEHIMVGAEGDVDPSTGSQGGSSRPATSCSMPRASVSTADLMLMTLALGVVLGRRRIRLFVAKIRAASGLVRATS